MQNVVVIFQLAFGITKAFYNYVPDKQGACYVGEWLEQDSDICRT